MTSLPLEGTYIEDIFSIALGNDELHFNPISIETSESDDTLLNADWRLFDGALLSIVFLHGNKQKYLGSAALVAPGVAISAMHIYDDHKSAIKNQSMTVVGITAGSEGVLEFWKCWGLVEIKGTDLSILSFDLACKVRENRKFSIFPLTTRVPEVGEQVKGIGFRAGSHEFETEKDGSNVVNGDVLVAAGIVTEVHINYRDRFLLPYPVFKFESGALGGMSGGPVLDSEGYMIKPPQHQRTFN